MQRGGGQLGDGGRGDEPEGRRVRSGWLATCLDDISRFIFVFLQGGVQCGGRVWVRRLEILARGRALQNFNSTNRLLFH